MEAIKIIKATIFVNPFKEMEDAEKKEEEAKRLEVLSGIQYQPYCIAKQSLLLNNCLHSLLLCNSCLKCRKPLIDASAFRAENAEKRKCDAILLQSWHFHCRPRSLQELLKTKQALGSAILGSMMVAKSRMGQRLANIWTLLSLPCTKAWDSKHLQTSRPQRNRNLLHMAILMLGDGQMAALDPGETLLVPDRAYYTVFNN